MLLSITFEIKVVFWTICLTHQGSVICSAVTMLFMCQSCRIVLLCVVEIAFSSWFVKLFVSNISLLRSTGASCTTFDGPARARSSVRMDFFFSYTSFSPSIAPHCHHCYPTDTDRLTNRQQGEKSAICLFQGWKIEDRDLQLPCKTHITRDITEFLPPPPGKMIWLLNTL